MTPRRAAAALLGLLALAGGCGGAAPVAAPEATTAPSPTPTPTFTFTFTPTPTPAPGPPPTEMPVVLHGPRTAKRVALTFDADMTTGMRARLRDGRQDSYYNADLIAVLRRLHVPATLFLTGMWMQEYPDVTRDLAADPLFELGTHSQSHRGFTADCYGLGAVPPGEMLAEVTEPVRILAGLDDHPTRWFRFPGGCYDARALRRTAAAGVTAIGTDLAGGDGHAPSARAIVDTVLGAVRPGAIVTMHMHGGPVVPLTDEAVALLVPALRARGYELVTVTDLLAPDRSPPG